MADEQALESPAATLGSVADEFIAEALEQNAARAGVIEGDKPAPTKAPPKGFDDPLAEELFSDEALSNPAVMRERAAQLKAERSAAIKLKREAHNARAEAERREAKFKGTKAETLRDKAAAQAALNMVQGELAELQSGDPKRFTDAVARLSKAPDALQFWREVATHIATGKPADTKPNKELEELRAELQRDRDERAAAVALQQMSQVDQQIMQARMQQIEQAKTYSDLPRVSSLAAEQPALVDARLVAIRTEHFQRTGTPLDIREACGMVEAEIQSHLELLQRAGTPVDGIKGAAAQVAGRNGISESRTKPAQAQRAPTQQAPSMLPTSLLSESSATKRGLTDAERREATIAAFDQLGIFGNFGM